MAITNKQAAGIAIVTGLASLLLLEFGDTKTSLPQFTSARARAANYLRSIEGTLRPDADGWEESSPLDKYVLVSLWTPKGPVVYRCEPGIEHDAVHRPSVPGAHEILRGLIADIECGSVNTKGNPGVSAPIPSNRIWEVYNMAGRKGYKPPREPWARISILDAETLVSQFNAQGVDYDEFGFLNRQPLTR